MAVKTKHVEITLGTRLESVNQAEEASLRVAADAGFDDDDCHKIGMAVREGVINAFHHGNGEHGNKQIHLSFDLTPEKLIIHVLDEGNGFNLASVPDPLAKENLLRSFGRGIFLMRAFMDEFDVKQGKTGGAEVIMSKLLPGARGKQGPPNGNRPTQRKGS
jgi:serine/threonine-protein kinase RsbW